MGTLRMPARAIESLVVTLKESTTSPMLQIRLLGDFSLTYRGEAVTSINTPRLHSLFAYLLFHRETPLRQYRSLMFRPWVTRPWEHLRHRQARKESR